MALLSSNDRQVISKSNASVGSGCYGNSSNNSDIVTNIIGALNQAAQVAVEVLNQVAVEAAPSTLSLSDKRTTIPDTLEQGKRLSVKGVISSNYTITNVTVGILDSNGKWTSSKYSESQNSRSFDLKNVDSKIKFGDLPVGSYKFVIMATDEKQTLTLQETAFKISGKVVYATESKITVYLGDELLGTFNGSTLPTTSKNSDGCGTATILAGTYTISYGGDNYNKHRAPYYKVSYNGSGTIPCTRSSYPPDGCPSSGADWHGKDTCNSIRIHQAPLNAKGKWSVGCITVRGANEGIEEMKNFAKLVGKDPATLIVIR